jgi:pyrophosphatase PpaX
VSFSTFLFDLDGTVVDSIELILRSYRHTLKIHRGTVPPDHLWLEGLGKPIWVQLQHWTQDPAEIAAMVETYRVYNMTHHDELVRPYEGIVDIVRRLKALGKRVGLVTSKVRTGALRGLRIAGLESAFDTVVPADEVQNAKPHPEPVLVAVERLGTRAAETVFIGDSRHDIVSGHAAGVKTAAALWGPFKRADLEDLNPDFWLERPRDIAQFLPDD